MIAELSSGELDRIADVISQGPYEGYPENHQRLFLGAAGLLIAETEVYIPEGSWHVAPHSNREGIPARLLDPEVPSAEHPVVDEELMALWRQQGLLLDQFGRPIHPDAPALLADPRIGLPTGVGFYFKYGPNATVDGVVPRQHGNNPIEWLLIKRKIGGRWAWPGGFKDRSDPSATFAARREIGEESDLYDIGGTDEILMHKRAVGLRDTMHAWTENTVVLIHGDQDYLFEKEPVAGDDADDVGWFTRAQIDKLEIFDAHQVYLEAASARMGE